MTLQIILGGFLLLLVFILGWMWSSNRKLSEQNSQIIDDKEDLKDKIARLKERLRRLQVNLSSASIEKMMVMDRLRESEANLAASKQISESMMKKVEELRTELSKYIRPRNAKGEFIAKNPDKTKNPKYKFPKLWCIKITLSNFEFLRHYRGGLSREHINGWLSSPNQLQARSTFHNSLWTLYKPEFCDEVTDDQFKKHILKQ